VFLLVGAPADPVQAAADAERLFSGKVAATSRSSARRIKPWSGATQSGKPKASRLPMQLLPSTKLRTFYKAVSKEVTSPPHFKSLPDALFFPNPEVLIFSCFATGVLSAASAVLGAAAAGYATTVRGLAVSIITIVVMGISYAHQGYCLFQFYRKHLANVWVDAEPPQGKYEVEDPLFAFLSNVTFGLFKPRPREWGGFEAPEEDTAEPARTERALARAFRLRPVKFGELPSGDALSQLQPWLGDSSGKGKTGIFYMFFMLVLQLITAVIIGILVVTPYGQTLLTTIIAMQLLGVLWCACLRTANDRIDGVEKLVCYAIEAVSTTLILVSGYVAEAGESSGDEEVKLTNLTTALQLATLSASLLMVSIFFPLAITVYNSFVVPLMGLVWKAEGDCREIVSQMVLTLTLLPYELASSFLGVDGLDNAGAVLGELEGSMVEISAASSDLQKKFDESEKDVGEDDLEDALMVAGAGVSRMEADAAARTIMNMSDVDGDGKLDQAELEVAMASADTDGDGVLEVEEVEALAAKQGARHSRVRFGPQLEAAPEKTVSDKLTTQRANPTKAVIKRLKREAFLARVRARRAARSATSHGMRSVLVDPADEPTAQPEATARKSEPASLSQLHALDHSPTAEEKRACLLITAGARGRQTRQALKQQQVETAAAQALLNAWRSHKALKTINQLRQVIEEARAAVKLQAVVRGSNARGASLNSLSVHGT